MLLTNSLYWKNKWYNIRAWFSPRQKWLIEKIPNTWCDATGLIPLCLFEIIRHFVEDENGLESIWSEQFINDPYVSDEYRAVKEPIRKELEEIYEYVKTKRALLEKQMDESYPVSICGGVMSDPVYEEDGKTVKHYLFRTCEQQYGMSYNDAYAEVNRLEALIEEKDTWAMNGIIKHRQYMWT